MRAAAAAVAIAHQALAAQRQAGAVEAFGAGRAAGRDAAAIIVADLTRRAQRHALAAHLFLALVAAIVRRRQAIARLRVAVIALRAGRHALSAERVVTLRAAVIGRHASAILVARQALCAGRNTLSLNIVIALRAGWRCALAAQVRIAAIRATRRRAVAIGIALGSLVAHRQAAAIPRLEALRALRRRWHAARRVINVALCSGRAGGQADPLISGLPCAGWHALPGLRVAPIAGGAGVLVVAAAQAPAIPVGAVRTVGHALQRIGRQHHAGRAVILRRREVRRTLIHVLQVAVIAIGAGWQWHLLITFRAAVLAGRRAQAGIARVAQPAIRAGGQAVIVVRRLAFGAARCDRRGAAATTGASTGIRRHGALSVGQGPRRSGRECQRQPQRKCKEENVEVTRSGTFTHNRHGSSPRCRFRSLLERYQNGGGGQRIDRAVHHPVHFGD